MRVLAIDPGYERLGIAVLEKEPSGKEILLFSECFQTPKTALFVNRLHAVGLEVREIIEKYSPEEINPATHSERELTDEYYSYPDYKEKIAEFGILAFELE